MDATQSESSRGTEAGFGLEKTPPTRSTERIGILLLGGFSLMALSAMSEPLRAANLISGKPHYEWNLLGLDDTPVPSSSGFPLVTEYTLEGAPPFDMVTVLASIGVRDHVTQRLLRWLRAVARQGIPLCGVSTAPYLLARAGLLEKQRCTVHWEFLRDFQEEFRTIPVERALYVMDGNRLTCAGGTAAMDLMLALIAQRHGPALAAAIAENFLHPRIRGGDESQRMQVQWRYGVSDARLAKAIGFMEQNMQIPQSPCAIADMAGVSSRQLERLFQKAFQASPARFYLELRLKHARTLLRQSSESIQQIADRCGFSSVSHFSRAYRAVFADTPARSRTL